MAACGMMADMGIVPLELQVADPGHMALAPADFEVGRQSSSICLTVFAVEPGMALWAAEESSIGIGQLFPRVTRLRIAVRLQPTAYAGAGP